MPLESVLKEIRKQSGYDVFYDSKIIPKEQRVDISLAHASLEEALRTVFKDVELVYKIEGKIISIRAKSRPGYLESLVARLQSFDVSGRVVDIQLRPLSGVTLRAENSNAGAVTDRNGRFLIKGINEGDILSFSYIGYQTVQIPARPDMGVIALQPATSKLDEIQVIAYGTTSRRLSTGNITTVKADDIEKQPVSNALLALQGTVPGMTVVQAGGFPGTGVTVRIQGQSSLTRGSDPLYVVDGIPYPSQTLPDSYSPQGGSGRADGGVSPSGASSTINLINPSDIESITILKDADATSIYGSRAAAGAILITTKKGKAGDTKVEANIQHGWARMNRRLELLNTAQYIELREEALKNDGLTAGPQDYDINGTWDRNRYTDWQDELLGNTAGYTDAQLGISGGTELTQFRISGGYNRQTTVYRDNYSDSKASISSVITNTSANRRFKTQLNLQYLRSITKLPTRELTSIAMRLPPNAPALYQPDGSLNWAGIESGGYTTSTWDNPLSYLLVKNQRTLGSLISSLSMSYKILEHLNLSSTFGYSNMDSDDLFTMPLTRVRPEYRSTTSRYATYGYGNQSTWQVEPQLDYHRTIGKGTLSVLVGATFLGRDMNKKETEGVGYASDDVLENMSAATALASYDYATIASRYKYSAIFSRVNYNWNDKYIVNATARRDGSSRFGPENLFNNFASVAGAWIFSNEKFVDELLPALSFGKLKVSYGTTGSDQIGDYQFMELLANSSYFTPYQQANALSILTLANRNLQWEETRKLSAGIDLGFFKDRILLNLNYYRNRSSNQLLDYNLPYTTGFGSVTQNMPATIQNSGWEISLNTVPVQNQQFSWKSNLNFTVAGNKLIRFDDLGQSSYATTYEVGQPLSFLRLYRYNGVDPTTGLFQFFDRNGNLTSNPLYIWYENHDAVEIVDLTPDFYGGFQNSFSYKGIQLDVLFQFTKQKGLDQNVAGFSPGSAYNGFAGGNQSVAILDRWKSPGDQGKHYQKVSSYYPSELYLASSAYGVSEGVVTDASYVRLKNISLSWSLPSMWLNKMRVNGLRIYTQGQNIFTITKFPGLDPETLSSTSLPPLRTITIGAQLTL
ncbi:putative outer membrane protein [Pedobacter sp. BAL39]|uniref:SusC/RagA family TonB-linked outer membrane protein n=1 Tax=Pedobacter sp. BAL39 TaxID=391596 RepID=UPI0001559357|nr:SusC/RagA family TonB-linked outer membrane protein [Pedobacter sp. BAL39]EDM34761.1 putative outer membrane protein [Pedobacter sp. BAL39]